MKKPATLYLNTPCLSEYVGVIRLAVSGLATRMDFTVEEIEDIKIAVSEACTNSVQYAYKNNPDGRIDLTCNSYKDELELIRKDTGCGFEVEEIAAKKPGITKDKLGLGLGITFIKSLMDKAEIKSTTGKGTTVKMVKKLPLNKEK